MKTLKNLPNLVRLSTDVKRLVSAKFDVFNITYTRKIFIG